MVVQHGDRDQLSSLPIYVAWSFAVHIRGCYPISIYIVLRWSLPLWNVSSIAVFCMCLCLTFTEFVARVGSAGMLNFSCTSWTVSCGTPLISASSLQAGHVYSGLVSAMFAFVPQWNFSCQKYRESRKVLSWGNEVARIRWHSSLPDAVSHACLSVTLS